MTGFLNALQGFLNALPGAVSQGLIWGIMAIGVYITYKILDIADLTVDGSFCTGGAVFVMLFSAIPSDLGPVQATALMVLALLAAMAAGMLAGLVTGLLHTFCGIPAILSGILTQLGLYSINLAIMNMRASQSIAVTDKEVVKRLLVSLGFLRMDRYPIYRHPVFVVGVFTLVIIGILYWFFGREIGAALRATGANEAMSRAQGINTNVSKILGLMIANGIVALSSAMFAHYQGAVDVNMGRGAIVIGLAAVIISQVIFGKLLRNFAAKLFGVALGAVIYYIVIQVVLWLGLNTNYLKMLSALTVAIFLAIPFWKGKLDSRRKGGKSHA